MLKWVPWEFVKQDVREHEHEHMDLYDINMSFYVSKLYTT